VVTGPGFPTSDYLNSCRAHLVGLAGGWARARTALRGWTEGGFHPQDFRPRGLLYQRSTVEEHPQPSCADPAAQICGGDQS